MITGHLVRSCGIYAPLVCGHEAVRLRLFGDEATALATPSHAIGHVPSSDVARGALAAHTGGWTSMEHPPQLNLIWKIATTKKGTLFILPSRLLSTL